MPPSGRSWIRSTASSTTRSQDDGDWTLIEPYGYVFRPHVNFVAWSPYQYGFWAPSDVYGWVWISAEPFGWATVPLRPVDLRRVPGLGVDSRHRLGPGVGDVDRRRATTSGWAPLPPRRRRSERGAGRHPYLYVAGRRSSATDLSSSTVKAAERSATQASSASRSRTSSSATA